jgi:molecular chaperone HscA
LALATRSALAADGELLAGEELAAIEALLAELERLAAGEDDAAITAAVAALADGTEGFAAARMNRGIQAALTGRKVEDI